MNKLSYVQRVAEGAALLDEHRPGWEMEIDLDLLALEDGARCILGQLWGSWADGLDFLEQHVGDIWQSQFSLGFQAGHAYSDNPDVENFQTSLDNEYKWLTRRWRELITARRTA